MKRFSLFLVLPLTSIAHGQGDPATIARIIDEGKNRNQAARHLQYLTKQIGPRLTGSPRFQRAADWTAGKFRDFGLQNVQLDKWGEMPVGFDRGNRQSARMLAPYERVFQFTTLAWTAGTNGPIRGRAVIEPTTIEELNRVRNQLRGAWVIGADPVTMRGPQPVAAMKEVSDAVWAAGIAGKVYSSSSESVHTHGRFQDIVWESLPSQIRVIIRKSDMEAVRQAVTGGREVTLEFDIGNRFVKGPVPLYNVVAEIKGTEKPDEVVILGAHLDSWDGPGSEGTNDNGTGSMVMLEAARILAKAKAKPKRTIRFILFGGEEQGLLGSSSYASRHQAEMDKVSAVFVDDGGTNYQGGVTATKDMAAMIEQALAPMNTAFPDMPVKVTISEKFSPGGGSDHFAFVPYGVPGFYFHETGRQNYGFVWHTQNDRFEQAIPEYLAQSSTNSAVIAYNLANADKLLPRVPKSGG